MHDAPRIELDYPHPDDEAPGALVRTPYLEPFIIDLKALLRPNRERRWMRDEYAWWVAGDRAEEIKQLVIYHYGTVEVVDEHGCCEQLP